MLMTVTFGSTQLKTLKASSPSKKRQVGSPPPLADTIQTVDRLYDSNKMKEALAYLERHSGSTDAEILWRLARLCYKVS